MGEYNDVSGSYTMEDFFSIQDVEPVIQEMLLNGGYFSLKGSGWSMYPFVRTQDQLLISAIQGRTIRRGDLIFFERDDGQYVMHRVYEVCKDGTYTFVGDNQVILEKGIREDQLRFYVSYIIRNGRKINCEHGTFRKLATDYMRFRILFPTFTSLSIAMAIKVKHFIRSLK